ncbi:hypothetical protein ABF162_14715 [Vibrio coralliilyticus]|uniref:hypothetical protein n=1 Tax=Vibrio coralliilyticus TaxID=190893 RepID=UPI000512902F|nr:hypothetical protein [Vibrio coralliilyticus]AIU68111.1 hypothetical protein JV59_38515 [Vibrio coralliilyticus]
MIVGFSHLIFNTPKVETVINDLKNQGYQIDFSELGLPNHTNKKPLLKFYSEKHDIHLLRHETHYDVEVLNHYSETSEVQNRLFNDKDKVVSIIIPTGKQPSESEFWANLGFKVNDGGVYLKRPVPAWDIEIQFTESSATLVEQKLDLNGFTSIAFITKNLQACKQLVMESASWISDTFSLEVNGKSLSIALMKSPTGIIIELIEV